MNREQLQDIFRQPYNAQMWQELLINLFGASEIRQTPSTLTSDSNEKVEGFELGRLYTGDRYEIGLFAFEIKHGHNVQLNRVGLRSLVRSYTRYNVDAALVVYYDATHWRLSFICDIKEQKTAPKRYTYVFGNPNESYRTASAMLAKLSDCKPLFENIKAAFSVEALSKDFFKGYKEQYGKFCKYIGGEQKWQRDYVKKMMGRLVFLQFLQKKGWMGVPANQKDWEGGDLQYTQNLIKRYEANEKLLSEILEPLFFDTLNTKREGDIADPKLGNNIKIPYLNGGLFDQDKLDEKEIDFPYAYFAELMDFFSQYNFTIDENDPNDAEVGIDPEMLGHIFENLLEDNKDKGAFYTPKEIVQYMCRQSLIEYLQSKLGKHTEIENFINNHDTGNRLDGKNYIVANAKAIEELLDCVKICDPAIGSGAFPMGILNEIFQAKMALDMTLDRAAVKKNIIQNSIYGVDIEQGAVDIARLRFWLSLVVDEDEPQPLPNLDYKIMCGNSLLSRYALDTPFEDVFKEYNKGKSESERMSLAKYKQLVTDYTNTSDHTQKAGFRKTIEDIKSAFRTELSRGEKEKFARLKGQITDLEAPMLFGERTKKEKEDLKKLKIKFAKQEQEQADIVNNKLYEDAFEWRFEFPQLLDDDGNFVGFDIVIGNPPYVQLQANGGLLAEQLKNGDYETFARTGDIYCIFYERGIHLLRDGGIETFITSNKWMLAGYGEKTRAFANKYNPLKIINLGASIFDSATVDTNILILQKNTNANQLQGVTLGDSLTSLNGMSFTPQSYSDSEIWTINSAIERNLKNKIATIGTPLIDWNIKIFRGVLTGYNEAFIIDTAKKEQLVAEDKNLEKIMMPILRGRDIQKYAADWAGLWLINTHNGVKGKFDRIDISDFPILKSHLETHWDKVARRADQGDTPYNLRNCAYLESFKEPKIVWKRIGSILRFCYDETGGAVLDSTCFATGNGVKYLVAVLNSKMGHYLLQDAPKTGTGDLLISVQALEPICIPKLTLQDQQPFIDLVDKILEAKQSDPNADTTILETKIDLMVYKLYSLTYDEVLVIDPQAPITQQQYEQ